MDYIQVSVTGISGDGGEILMARMAELGFESFTETEDGLQGFIPVDLYDEQAVCGWLQKYSTESGIFFRKELVKAQNWNAIWESGYEPVVIEGRCMVRAPFHEPKPGVEFDLIIEPRMSFGTAHHETTSLMISMLMEEGVAGKRVLDMGCGTAVLAILAHKMNARSVVAIDNDEWAYANAQDNIVRNDAKPILVLQGDASAIASPAYDLIIANINRNILLQDIPVYASTLAPGGVLLMSGFYEDDLLSIQAAAGEAGLKFISHRVINSWTGAKFTR